jgi:hypothetical protein
MKKLFRKMLNLKGCLFGKHEWEYLWGNYQTGKDVFQCKHCGRKIEE